MAIIPGEFCEDCADREEQPVPAEHELDAQYDGSGGGGFLCDNCYSNRGEAAHERMLEDYYGSSSPQTIQEQHAAAHRDRRELRKRD